jgi:hypothetical protein
MKQLLKGSIPISPAPPAIRTFIFSLLNEKEGIPDERCLAYIPSSTHLFLWSVIIFTRPISGGR